MRSLIFIALALLFSCKNFMQEPEEAIYLIPKGYIGSVIIMFAQKEGIKAEHEGNKLIYRIPNNGVLKTEISANFKGRSQEFYTSIL